MSDQETMFEIAAAEGPWQAPRTEPEAPPKLKVIDRNQFKMLTLDVNTLVAADHKVRAIWEITGNLDLSRFQEGIRSRQGQAGREHNDPRLLVAVWVYAYSQGISSAREVSRQMEHEPGLRWLAGLEVINHTTLSDFARITKQGWTGCLRICWRCWIGPDWWTWIR